MYGYGINLKNNAITKVGAGGTGVYSKGGNVTVMVEHYQLEKMEQKVQMMQLEYIMLELEEQ